MPAMKIDLQLQYAPALAGLRQFNQQLKQTQQLLQRTAGAGSNLPAQPLKQAAAPIPPVVNQQLVAVNSFNQIAARARSAGPSFLSGPNQQLARAQANLAKAAHQGNTGVFDDAKLAVQRAQRALARSRPPSRASALMNLVASTRLNIPGMGAMGASPLVGRLAAAAGGGPAGLAIVGAMTAATAAVQIFAKIVQTATSALSDLAHTAITTNSSGDSVAFMRTLGIDPSFASGMRERMANDPMAMGAAQRLGLGVLLPGQFGGPGAGDVTKQVVQALAAIDDPMRRYREAVRLNAESLLPAIELYRRHGETIDKDAAITAKIADPETMKAAEDLQFQFKRIQDALLDLATAAGAPFLREIGDLLGLVADAIKGMALIIKDNAQTFKTIVEGVFAFMNVLKILHAFMKSIPGLGSRMGAFDPDSALNANTKATQQNTWALGKMTGTFGGGQRARGAMPGAWTGMGFAMQGAAMQRMSLGAFAL